MIIYEGNITDFIYHCNSETDNISNIISENMNRARINFSPSEYNSWKNSLPAIADTLNHPSVPSDINVAVEYKSNFNKSRMDCIIYGCNDENITSAVIIELKQWSEVSHSNRQNMICTNYGAVSKEFEHPSYQSLRYRSILECFNEYVQLEHAVIKSCSFLHNLEEQYNFVIKDEKDFPYIKENPVFIKNEGDKLRDFIKRYVKKGKKDSLYKIDDSRIRPSKEFSELFFNALKGDPIFTLDDEQSNSVSEIVFNVRSAIECGKRKTIIIKGGPGSGKSIVAINAMGQLLHPPDGKKELNVCYTTANFTPNTYFGELLVDNNHKKVAINNLFKKGASLTRAREFDYDCIMIDEAHRQFKWKFSQGVKKEVDFIDRLFNASRVNVWFIDEDQIITKDDSLTIELIKKYAKKHNSDVIESEELHLTSEFRCMGGTDYIDFIRGFLGYTEIKKKYKRKNYEFDVCKTPSELWKTIYDKQTENEQLEKDSKLCRIVAGYTHEWLSKKDNSKFDFVMDDGNFKMKWNKFKSDGTYINDATQKDRIGCVHTIQGLDLDYVGVIIGKDMIYRNGKVSFDKRKNKDVRSGISKLDDGLAERMIRNTYNVLLTRGKFGTFVYCEDDELNEYLKSLIG